MAYLVLARKWRPQRFSEVVGQETIVKTLSAALMNGRVAHAFLLTGSRGVGKTTVARLLAKALSCEQGINPEPCGVCTHCQEIASGQSMDVIEIDGASNTGVDDVRSLRDQVRYPPVSARFKIFIIDEVHMLSTNAFNALLKTLEEPPPHVKFIFATTEAHKIPITILSRCQRYDFKRMKVSTIIDRLQAILREEHLQVEEDGLRLIAENADGGMRDALSLLDQVISFAGENASASDVTEILGLIDRQTLAKMTRAILEGQSEEIMKLTEAAANTGLDYKQLLDGIALELRHLSIAAAAGSIEGLADLSAERVQQIDALAKRFDPLDLQRLLGMALEGTNQLSGSEHPRWVFELVMLRMTERPQMNQLSEIQKAIARLEALGSAVAAVTPAVTPGNSIISPAIEPGSMIGSRKGPGMTESARGDTWKSFVAEVEKAMPVIGYHLEHGRYDGKSLIEFDQKLHYSRVHDAVGLPEFKAICQRVLGTVPQVTLSESIHVAKESAIKREQENIEEKARNHPTIQKALAVFGGEIKGVRKL